MKLSILVFLPFAIFLGIVCGQQCGSQAGGAQCQNQLCCSRYGYCGTSADYCGSGCQSQCWSQERADHRCGPSLGYPPCGENRCCSVHGWCGGAPGTYCQPGVCQYRCWYSLSHPLSQNNENAISKILRESLFNEMFKHRNDCPSQGFYSYDAFITAAASFPSFCNTGDLATRKRELAAFLAQTSQATTGLWSDSLDQHAWGYCHINTTTTTLASAEKDYCTSSKWPCASGKKYNSRGPIQLAHNYNYGLAGKALGLDLINDPDLVALDPVVSFKTAIWFWMTKHDNKPSCHDVLIDANSKPGQQLQSYSVIVNIMNGASGNIAGLSANSVSNSIGYYKRYCDMLQVSYGDNLQLWYDDMHSLDANHIKMPVI